MLLTIVGLAITTIVSIEGTISSDRRNSTKVILIALALTGFGVALMSTRSEAEARREAGREAEAARLRMNEAVQRLKSQQALLDIVNASVSDLAILNSLASDRTLYYVQIAADTIPKHLEDYKSNIDHMFPGAERSKLVAVREPEPGSHMYKLVFGQHLHAAAAEVFHRLAMSHGFPPDNQRAEIHRER
jgi:hypothetical protein